MFSSLFSTALYTPQLYTLSLHDALPIYTNRPPLTRVKSAPIDEMSGGEVIAMTSPPLISSIGALLDRKSTRLNSSHANISYAVFCLKKKNKNKQHKKRDNSITRIITHTI